MGKNKHWYDMTSPFNRLCVLVGREEVGNQVESWTNCEITNVVAFSSSFWVVCSGGLSCGSRQANESG